MVTVVPQNFVAFFSASTGAGAALVGLLFVAVSIAPEHIVAQDAPIERQAVAASTFTAMVNAFFISISALVPGTGMAIVTLIVSASSIVSSLSLAWHLLRQQRTWLGRLRGAFLVLVALALYGYEFADAFTLVRDPHNVSAVFFLAGLLIGVYGLGLARAWQLLGARRFGFSGWLSVIRDLETPGTQTRQTAVPNEQTSAPDASTPR
jgi:hypothetical protein